MPSEIAKILSRFPRADLMGSQPTPLERLNRLSDQLGIDLWLKRDDLSLLGFGGNKIRQLEFYLGDALDKGADTILITGAVQSNFVRSTAAAAARCGFGHNGKTDGLGFSDQRVVRLVFSLITGNTRNTGLDHPAFGLGLVPHEVDSFRGRTNEDKTSVSAGFGEGGVLR